MVTKNLKIKIYSKSTQGKELFQDDSEGVETELNKTYLLKDRGSGKLFFHFDHYIFLYHQLCQVDHIHKGFGM